MLKLQKQLQKYGNQTPKTNSLNTKYQIPNTSFFRLDFSIYYLKYFFCQLFSSLLKYTR